MTEDLKEAINTKFQLSIGPTTQLISTNTQCSDMNRDNFLEVRELPKSSVFVFLDKESDTLNNSYDNSNQNNDSNTSDIKRNCDSDAISPKVIRLNNLTCRGIRTIAANPGSINVVTDNNELLTAETVITEDSNPNVEFNSPSSFDLYDIVNVSCGAEHTIAIALQGQQVLVFGCGNNSLGQLGMGRKVDYTPRFRPIRFDKPQRFFQTVCGSFFTLLLTDTAKVWAFGHNNHGQLGADIREEIVNEPILVDTLNGVPITHLAAGSSHSLALSATGILFAAGSNSQGQLGLSSNYDQYRFTPVEALSGVFVVFIAAHGCYSAAIDEFGSLYLWGGKWGSTPQIINFDCQHNQSDDLLHSLNSCNSFDSLNSNPGVPSFNQKEIFVDVALGNDGRIAALTSHNNLIVSGYYVDFEQVLLPIEISSPILPFAKLFCAGEYFVVIASNTKRLPLSNISYSSGRSLLPPTPIEVKDRLRPPLRILALNYVHFPDFLNLPGVDQAIHLVFSSISTLNASFLVDNFHESMADVSSGIDVHGVIDVYNHIIKDLPLMHILTQSFNRTLVETQEKPPKIHRPITMRFLMIALLHPSPIVFRDGFDFWRNLIQTIDRMNAYQILVQWLSVINPIDLERVLESIKDFLTAEGSESRRLYSPIMVKAVQTMEIVWFASTRTKKLPFDKFYHDTINQMIDIRTEYQLWSARGDNWCYSKRAPWILNADTKTRFIRLNSRQMMNAQQMSAMANATQFWGEMPIVTPLDLYLILSVDRNNVLLDTFQQICYLKKPDLDLKKPLKVIFKDEPGVDEGGVQREFFELIVNELLDPKKGIFISTDEQHWFNRKSTDPSSLQSYMLAGVVVGLAIYNGNLLNVRFPIVLYKKLRGLTVNFNDLKELDSQLYTTLTNILEYEGDVENDMCLTYDYEGFPLKPNGLDIPVTNSNREEYVSDVSKYILNKSVEKQFEAFKQGFMQSAGDIVLDLFRPEELALLVAGREELDFIALQKNTRYEGFTSSSEPVRAFWHIAHTRLTDSEKKKLLYFITSSPRAPINGLGAIPFVIAKDGNPEHIPTSHTCFFMLVLPDDPNEDRLYHKLKIAIDNAEGFAFK
ncbi:hypothetical protein TRFO_31300 [Tritrichomonas foetus]|uniref:HECT domain-containing protein n=1 Tax=Tritrichomonas foetus TaxID=1144522 RepID=A0A1J4JTJ3_9EUKA|nr:hypothetical protein TRFO_31300 [Tritrichomonas foetus]|eukprot:OHT01744.1 hypothetical protein TRFO_31300 [Tritrichomonas foetus]